MSIYRCRSFAALAVMMIVGALGSECTPNECLLESDCSSGMSCVAGKCAASAADASPDAVSHKDAESDARRDAPLTDAKHEGGDSELLADAAKKDGDRADAETGDAEKPRDGSPDARSTHDGEAPDAGGEVDAARVDARHD